ncbi:TIGR01777 family oxidoreductase [Staphylococcus sp. 17KM0847]|uniref:TIGR01777 family oxidoreductase n=1 Tax=Staphylococcus sp. 17KM0847 TaxID=2583989 RepID=UPI0015DD2479|nr:TIGR01777 family oxidoreductase [Staphylococcus sp. 17KM0847]QLK85547.1 TIGR01777 family protein [Staphylococcus sp. 17KM0847]
MTTYLISGGTGLVGQKLIHRLLQDNKNHIYVLTRAQPPNHKSSVNYINWSNPHWEKDIPNIDIVINLAGATLSRYWTKQHQQDMMTSRIQATRALYDLFHTRPNPPSVLFNASAIGYYPPSKRVIYTENTQADPHDLLSEIVYQWERQADLFNHLGTRVIYGRFGLVLSKDGGALPIMALPYRLMVGGKIGDGKQWYSWIHIEDLVTAIIYLVHHSTAQGAYNLTAPYPVTQHEFGQTLGQVLYRPHYMRVPGLLMRLALGHMSTLMLDTQYVLPHRLKQLEFPFQFPHLKEALCHIYNM